MEPFDATFCEEPGAPKLSCRVIALTGQRINSEPELLIVISDGEVRTAVPHQLSAPYRSGR